MQRMDVKKIHVRTDYGACEGSISEEATAGRYCRLDQGVNSEGK